MSSAYDRFRAHVAAAFDADELALVDALAHAGEEFHALEVLIESVKERGFAVAEEELAAAVRAAEAMDEHGAHTGEDLAARNEARQRRDRDGNELRSRWSDPAFLAAQAPILAALAASRTPLQQLDMRGITVGGNTAQELPFVHFQGRTLTAVDLRSSVLSASFADAIVERCMFDSSRLLSCVMLKAQIRDSSFEAAYLEGCYLTAARVSGSRFTGAEFRDRVSQGMDLVRARFSECDFSGAKFVRAELRAAQFANCNFEGARFEECDLRGTKFVDGGPGEAQLVRCVL